MSTWTISVDHSAETELCKASLTATMQLLQSSIQLLKYKPFVLADADILNKLQFLFSTTDPTPE
jgi:hypothetical protein